MLILKSMVYVPIPQEVQSFKVSKAFRIKFTAILCETQNGMTGYFKNGGKKQNLMAKIIKRQVP